MQMDFGLLVLAYRPCFLASSFLYSIISIGLRTQSCQLPSCNLFTSHGYFIVFWERDITSEHHRTPVHISNTVYTRYQFTALFTFQLLSLSLLSRAFLSFVNNEAGGIYNLSVLVGSKAICCVCRS